MFFICYKIDGDRKIKVMFYRLKYDLKELILGIVEEIVNYVVIKLKLI